jgi:hypothetical protein
MFLALGVVGAVLLLAFIVFDDVLDAVLPDNDWLSGPILAAFLAAFGIVGWAVDSGFDAPTWLAVAGGIGGGLGLGYATYRITRAVAGMATDATPTPQDFVGREGKVITTVQCDRVGEVLITVGGQPVKLTAVADREIERGAPVVVVESMSPTKVVVQSAQQFWGAAADPGPTP